MPTAPDLGFVSEMTSVYILSLPRGPLPSFIPGNLIYRLALRGGAEKRPATNKHWLSVGQSDGRIDTVITLLV